MPKQSELDRVLADLEQQIAVLQAAKDAILAARRERPTRVRTPKPKPAKDAAA